MDDGTKRRRRRRWVFALIAVLIGVWLSRSWWAGPAVPGGSYVLLDLQGDYAERAPDGVLKRLFGEPTPSLFDVLAVIREAAEDSRVAGMVVRVRSLEIGWAKAQDIRDALLRFRNSGKPLRAYLEQEFANSTLEYYIASAADTIDLPPAGTAPLSGLVGAVRLPRRRLGQARHPDERREDPRVQDLRRHDRQQGDVPVPARDGELPPRQPLLAAGERNRQ